jgi:hypothetical protein
MDTATSPTTDNGPRWFHPTPARLLIVLLVVEGILLLSEPFQWFPFNEKKGYTVLIAIAVVGITVVLMLIWWAAALCLHWRFQFSLRSLTVLTVAVAIPFSWLAVGMKKAREQRVAVVEIEKRGGSVRYDDLLTGMAHPPLPVPLWLQRLLSSDFFEDVMQVSLWNTPATDADLKLVEGLPGLLSLCLGDLDNTQVTDNGLDYLKGLTQLKDLSLSNTRVTDAGLKHRERLTQLQELHLGYTPITDIGLERLKGLTQLEGLDIYNTKTTDNGVRELQKALPNCHIDR